MTRFRRKCRKAYDFIKDYESLSEGTAGRTWCCKTCRDHLQERRLLSHDEQEVQASMSSLMSWEMHIPDRYVLVSRCWNISTGEEALLTGNTSINISSDIIESTFGIYKSKKSPNKLYGVTPFVTYITVVCKSRERIRYKTIDFKERIVNVKLKDIRAWATEHLSKNWVTKRPKTLKNVS